MDYFTILHLDIYNCHPNTNRWPPVVVVVSPSGMVLSVVVVAVVASVSVRSVVLSAPALVELEVVEVSSTSW